MKDHDLSPFHLAKKLIEKNFDEKISQEFLCRKTGLNDYRLKKGFKESFGITIREYQVTLKMAQAKKMLAESNEKIAGVAYTIGYEHHSSFSLEFKKRFGVSPKGYRGKRQR